MPDFDDWLLQLRQGPHITKLALKQAPTKQGAYVLWLDTQPPVCLKIGVAGPRRGEGIMGRLRLHYSSNPSNSVLARHMINDSDSPWAQGYDFGERLQRQEFIANKCFFQAIPLPKLS